MIVLFILFVILRWVVQLYIWILWARFILDLVRVFNPSFRPRGVWLVVVELLYSITDPPIKFIRKVLPPIRIGQVALDLGWMLTMLACIILLSIFSFLTGA